MRVSFYRTRLYFQRAICACHLHHTSCYSLLTVLQPPPIGADEICITRYRSCCMIGNHHGISYRKSVRFHFACRNSQRSSERLFFVVGNRSSVSWLLGLRHLFKGEREHTTMSTVRRRFALVISKSLRHRNRLTMSYDIYSMAISRSYIFIVCGEDLIFWYQCYQRRRR